MEPGMRQTMSTAASGATPQAQASGPASDPPTQVAAPPPPGVPNVATAEQPQESFQPKFATTPSYPVPAPSFSYGVISKSNAASGSSQLSPSSPAASQILKLNPPTSAATLQPPVPGQSSAIRPSFSYNIMSQANVGSAGSQQQSSTPTVPVQQQGGKLTPTTSTSMQPLAPEQSGHSNQSIPGKIPHNVPSAMRPPFPVQKGHPSMAVGFSFSGSSQLPGPAEASPMNLSSNMNTSAAVAQETSTTPPTSSSTQSMVLPTHTSSSSLSATPVPPNMISSSMRGQAALPGTPGMPGTLGTPGSSGMPSSSPLSFVNSIWPTVMDSSASLRPMQALVPLPQSSATPVPAQNVQQHVYPSYPSMPAITPNPPGIWLPPPQMGGLQRPPFVPYPAPLSVPVPIPVPGAFPMQMRGMVHPSVLLPDSQPPGVSPAGPSGGMSPAIVGSGQPLNKPQSPPPGIEQAKQDNESINKDGDMADKEDADAWTAHKTETGIVYYYNALTGESTYEKPSSFKGEVDKVTAQSTPVSSEKLASTDWVLVTTNDGKKYYYNTKTKVSSWQVPLEVAEVRKKQESDSLKANAMTLQPSSILAPSVNTGGRDAIALRTSVAPVSSSALDLIKKKLQDAGTPAASSQLPASSTPMSDLNGQKSVEAENSKEKLKDANGDGNMSDSSSDSDDIDSGPTKEECVIQFKEMLKERGVAPFSKWEKELPKILFDPRFKAVPGYGTRRALFEHYVRTRAEEERKEKRAAQKAAIEGFKKLLEEASEDIDHRTDYQTFKRKWGNDPRFEALDRKDREILLNEKVLPLKKAAEEKIQATRSAAISSFKSMLREKEDINTSSRWSTRVKDSLRNDPRYRSVKHEDREVLFNEYISELKAAEEESERAEKVKREEQEKLKEREREMRKRKEREEQEMERVRMKVRRKEAISSYQALLVETIKDPKASWTESKPKLEKDPQSRATNPDLDKADAEKLFREHAKVLYERCANDYRNLLSEVVTAERAIQVNDEGKTILTSWSEAKQLLKDDPRYSRMPRKDRESVWRRYAEEMQRKHKLESDVKEEKPNVEARSRISSDPTRSSPPSRRSHSRR